MIFNLENGVSHCEKDADRILVCNTIHHMDLSLCEVVGRDGSLLDKIYNVPQ